MSAPTLSTLLGRLADAADHGPSDGVPTLLAECLAACAHETTISKTPQADLQQRLTVWRDVWPRLGKDPQFRAAVAREAHRWSAALLQQAQRG